MPPPPGESTHRSRVNGTNGHRTGEHPPARGPSGTSGTSGTNGAGGYGTGERPAVRPGGGAYRTGEVPAAGGARHRASGEWQAGGGGPGRKAPADYTYRVPRTDRRQIMAVGLALVLVFGVSLAIVTFTRGEQGTPSRSDAPVTSVPPGESTVPSSVPVPGSPGPQAPGPTASTAPPPGESPLGESPAADGGTDAAPEIGRFGAVEQGLGPPCEATQRRITLAWESTGGTSARIEGPGAPTGDLPANGQATACRATGPPQTYTLTVTGPGGSTFRTTSV